MKLFVWEDTEIGGGSAFGGTLCVIAETSDEAREKARKAFKENPGMSGYEDMHKNICFGDNDCVWNWLERSLTKEPECEDVVLARGGDL